MRHSGISTVPYYVGAVLQNAFIAVDEEGTEAAAATVIATAPGSSALEAPKALEFHVDRPFLFFIRHTATGVVLFMGHVNDPTA